MRSGLPASFTLVSVRISAALAICVWAVMLAQAEDQTQSAPGSGCTSAEECFRAAQASVPGVTTEERRRQQVERLRLLRQQFPDTPWAHRAGVALGLQMTERDPLESARLFSAARGELPILEDYVRYWEADARLRAGELTEAAQLFEAIPQTTPDTLLKNRSAFSAGQAWIKAADCGKAMPLLQRTISADPQNAMVPPALLSVADCQMKASAVGDSRSTLKHLWIKYPNTPSAREALLRLNKTEQSGTWSPSPDDVYGRAQAFSSLTLYAEAVDEFQRFLAVAPIHPRRDEARAKLATALIRLKRYEQARPLLQELMAQKGEGAGEATVSLARIYLRQGDGERLLALRDTLSSVHLTSEQHASILLMVGIWLDDQRRWEEAVAAYQQAIQAGATPTQRADALWRTGWIRYRNAQWREALESFDGLLKGKDDPQWTPQLLYWRARTLERQVDSRSSEAYQQVCRQYALTYYCQLAKGHMESPQALPPSDPAPSTNNVSPGTDVRAEIERDAHYRKARELKLLKQEPDAARELGSLTEKYSRDRNATLVLSGLLSEAGAHYEALRLARQNFRDSLERGGDQVPTTLWIVAYPTVYLPTIRLHAGARLDPYLAAAVIREESQYDTRAVSRTGALGLMQLMPETARSMARRLGGPEVIREDLFNQEINIRYGTRYLEELVEQFSGNVVYAVAAYNAGPVAVSSWVTKNGTADQEEFVEMVPYQETRQYVKRVLRSYWEYRRVNGDPCRGRLLDKVC